MEKPKSKRGGQDAGVAVTQLENRRSRGEVVEYEETIEAGARRARVRSQTMLDRYLQRSQVTWRQFDAGERLYGLWRATGQAPKVTASYAQRVSGTPDMSDRQAAVRADVTKVLNAMGERLASILVHVCFCDEAAGDWGERHRGRPGDGIAVLRLALDSLADYWGVPR